MAPGRLTARRSRTTGAGVTDQITMGRPRSRRFGSWFHRIGLIIIYGLCSAIFAVLGFVFHHKGFKVQPPPGQIYAMAFTKNPDASVSVVSSIYPRQPWLDRVKVDATVSPGRQVPWLLVIQCPHAPRTAPHRAELYSQTGGQMPSMAEPVNAYSHTGPFTEYLRCFAAPTTTAAGQPHSILDVALPALETDAAIAASPLPPTVYTERDTKTGRLTVMQVFPDLICPSPSIALQGSAGEPAGQQPGGQPVACKSQAAANSLLNAYHTPVGVSTTEVLSGVSLRNYQLESVFPVPQRQPQGVRETFIWSESSAVDPSLQVADTEQQREQGQDTFYAGVFFGILGATGVAFLERIWSTFVADERRNAAEAEARAESQRLAESRPPPTGPPDPESATAEA
jgi:hypothetical protein